MAAIDVRGLKKSYGDVHALRGLDLTIERTGQIIGLLGANGAGKTTFVEILEGLRTATAGTASADIAKRLNLSEGTVRNYLSESIAKLGVSNRIEAARLARQRGWL